VPDAAPFAFAMMQRDGMTVFLNSLDAILDAEFAHPVELILGVPPDRRRSRRLPDFLRAAYRRIAEASMGNQRKGTSIGTRRA
jgi:hypothetical protein